MKSSKPYLLYSDVHYHSWSQFATVDANGFNSRLMGTIAEVGRAHKELVKDGGNVAICGGDLFHIRGRISPTVLNPVLDFYQGEMSDRIVTHCLSGNHDLESADARSGHSMVEALSSSAFHPVNKTRLWGNLVMIPWFSSVEALRDEIQKAFIDHKGADKDLIIHAPVDGVLKGIPESGLTADWLSKQGFKRVFSGHYHNHKDFGNGVWSIGATGHQSWSDVGSKAGFLLVYDEHVEFFESHLPKFIDLGEIPSDEDELLDLVDGNYVRVTLEDCDEKLLQEVRRLLIANGSKGVLIRGIPSATSSSARGTTTAMDSVESSIIKYADKEGGADLSRACLDVYKSVVEVAA